MSKVILALCLLLAVTMVFAEGDVAREKWGHRHHNHHNHHSHHRHHPHSHNPHKHTPAPIPPKAPPVPKMPCKMQTCEMVCKLVTKKLGESKYAITYQEKVCAFDAKCEAANAKCVPQLIALMKAAEAAEKALEKASAAKAAAKGNHAKATAAKEAALKEQSAAKGALDAAQALVNEATSAAATAKTQYGENSAIYKKRAAAAEQALKTYQAMKKEHLHAQGEFKGKASAEMKAYNEYTAALNKHCDEEAAFAAIVASIGHPIKKAECKTRKIQTEATKMPCEIPVCHPICTQEPATLDYSTYTIKYGQMKCVDDQKCENAKAKCMATLTGVMKAAQDAEVSLKKASQAAAGAKSNHAKATAAKQAAAAEMAAAKKAMRAAESEFKQAETEAAGAKASKEASHKVSVAADKKLADKVKEYNAAKKSHLEAQAKYEGASSAAAKALAEFNKRVKEHCTFEEQHTKLVQQLGHGHMAQDNCNKLQEEDLLLEEFDEEIDDELSEDETFFHKWLKHVPAGAIKKAIAAAKKAGAKEKDEFKFLPAAVKAAAKAKAEEAELEDAVAEDLDLDAQGCTTAYAGKNFWGHRGCCGIFREGASCGRCSNGYVAHNHNGNCGLEGSYTCCPP